MISKGTFKVGQSEASGTPTKPSGGVKKGKDGDPSIFDSKKAGSDWKDVDTDKDGYLTKDELYADAQRTMKALYPDQDVIYDADNNLTAKGVEVLNSMMNDDIYKKMDEDGNGQIDKGEFDSYYAELVEDEPNIAKSGESEVPEKYANPED